MSGGALGVAASTWRGSVADYRKIMILVLEGRSYGEVVEAVGCTRRDVSAVKRAVAARGITAGAAASMTNAEVRALFPDGRRRVSEEYERPDFAAVLKSMKANRHFTLQQAWRRYIGADGQGRSTGTRSTATCSASTCGSTTWWRRCTTSPAGRYWLTGPATPWSWWTRSPGR